MRRIFLCFLWFLGWVSMATVPTRSWSQVPPHQEYIPPDYIRQPMVLPPHMQHRKSRQIALREAIESTLSQNLDIALKREQVRAVANSRYTALGNFEPDLRISLNRNNTQTPPQTAQEGQAGQTFLTSSDQWNLTISEKLPTGTQLRMSFLNSRQDSTLGNVVAPLLYRSSLLFTLSQPLLRDFSFDGRVQWAPVLKAEFDSEAARENARLAAMVNVKFAEDAYWTLVESWKSYEVNLGARELAEKQLELTRRQIAAGVAPESALISIEGTLAQRQVAVVSAEAQIERAADALRKQLNMPPSEWDEPLLPLDAPEFARMQVPFAEALERAMASRPEFKQVQIEWRKIGLDLTLAKNARLPSLNAQASIGTVGQDQEYARALEQVGNRAGWQWSVGMDFAWAPIGVGARAEIRRILSGMRQNGISREQLVAGIRVQIRDAIRSIDTAERQLYASAKSRDLAERNLDVETRMFLNGTSSNFMVGQRQADLAQARLAELSALIQHQKARSELQMAMGEILEARQLRFEVRSGR